MKTKIDSAGRIGIPKKIRLLLHWEAGTHLDISINADTGEMILRKTEKSCICCGTKKNLFHLKDEVYLCSSCAEEKQK
ncbi:MAG: AbrB/MazE/SpoVT family DNA-binding domain-containing protein [Clostridia bacterium]|nr:AbrB/MazE/SpoVT family DNA-binding domain-containing protein [Clostridia bacterium]